MSNVSFIELPKIVRKGYLINGTEQYRESMKHEKDHHKFTFFDDYKYYSWLKYYAEDYKYDLYQDAETSSFYVEYV